MRLPARLMLEQVADAVIYADAAGTIVLWNDAAAALFGYNAAEAVGQSLDLIIPKHHAEGALERLRGSNDIGRHASAGSTHLDAREAPERSQGLCRNDVRTGQTTHERRAAQLP